VKPRYSSTIEIKATAPEQRVVYGWARVARDVDGRVVYSSDNLDQDVQLWQSIDEIEAASHLYLMDSRGSTDAHVIANVAVPVASIVFTPAIQAALGIPEGTVPEGWFVGLKVLSDEVWDKVRDGTYQSFSIGGGGERVDELPEAASA
jgi:hypothetical protein